MEKIAFLFSGQGSQFVGMSKNLYDNFDVAKKTFDEANDVLEFDLAKLCFEGQPSELNKTVNAQTALLVASVATFRVFMHKVGIIPQFCAGHSLGEYSALTASGALAFSDALKLVRFRGEICQRVADYDIGVMSVINGLPAEIVEKECKKMRKDDKSVWVSCLNSSHQTVVSGHEKSVLELEGKLIELGAKIRSVFSRAPFHSLLMEETAKELREYLDKCEFLNMRYPVVSNVTARPYTREIPVLLEKQMTHPVRWSETINYLESKGITSVIELGPKNVLCNLTKHNSSLISTYCYGLDEDRTRFEKNFEDCLYKNYKPDVVSLCIKAVVSSGNYNNDLINFKGMFFEKFQKLNEIKKRLNNESRKSTKEEDVFALKLVKEIFELKKVSECEQDEWFNTIHDETATILYEIKNN